MKCIRCDRESEYAERVARRCPHCGGEVAFEPREGDPLSDDVFVRTMERTSAEGTLRFTPGHLYYDLCRNLGKGAMLTLPRARFDQLWDRWVAVHGVPAGTVTPWPDRGVFAAREADLGDYSFDRVVITDHAWMVDFLLANNFHFETNSAVLSIDGHPADRFALLRGMLRKNPRIIVIAVHDASVEGCALPRRLVTEDGWFRDHGHVIDVGLTAAHRDLYGEMWLPRAEPAPLAGEGADAEWLARYSLDLAVVRPEKAMRRLFRATRAYNAVLAQPTAPRVGEVHTDPALLGPGPLKQQRGPIGEEP
jgi:DNA-directed RNA polymerase subunit RPC12/RpoP